MPRDKLRRDVNETAFDVVQAATGQGAKPKPAGQGKPNPTAAARGRQGGKKGGKARADTLTPDELVKIAKQGAAARWKNRAHKVRKSH